MYSAIDRVVDTMERKLRRHKERIADRRTRVSRTGEMQEDLAEEETEEEAY